jgi:hypothetical protein
LILQVSNIEQSGTRHLAIVPAIPMRYPGLKPSSALADATQGRRNRVQSHLPLRRLWRDRKAARSPQPAASFDHHRRGVPVVVLHQTTTRSNVDNAMKVRELIRLLEGLPNQDALVMVSYGESANEWLIATGVVERGMAHSTANPDFAVPGSEPGVEIV